MSNARLVVNDEVLFDGDVSTWVSRPPEFIAAMADQLQPGSQTRPEGHMLAIMATFGDAVARQADIIIECHTGPGWWKLDVKE